jgi:polyisoprenoid-binding protein YceI
MASEAPPTTLNVVTTESTVQWTARKVTGKHTGQVNIREGKVHMTEGHLTKAEITIDMSSITVTDLSGNGKAKLENHLKSDDFFGVEKFPSASLVTTSVTPVGEEDYTITADLTIRGITHPIKFDARIIPDGKKYIANAHLIVDRTLYDVKYRSGKFFADLGDSTIYDEFDLDISLTIE